MSEDVIVAAAMAYRRWLAPNFATWALPPSARQEGLKVAPSTPVADLDDRALDALAQAWLNDLYAKANRRPPDLLHSQEPTP